MTTRKATNLFIFLSILSFLIIIFNDNLDYSKVREIFRLPVKPFIRVIDFTIQIIGDDASEDMLIEYLAEEKMRKSEFQYARQENDILREMLELKDNFSYKIIAAEIIGGNQSDESEIVLCKGTNEGINEGMSVIFLNGIVGRISESTENHSIVETHTNMNTKIGVCDKDRRYFMIAEYFKKNLLKVENVQYDYHMKKGDSLFTSGFGSIYPPNLPVGEVIESYKSEDGDSFYVLRPFENINSLRMVFVLGKIAVDVPSIFKSRESKPVGNMGWFKIMRRQD